jgi:hypothetical protein
VAATVSMKLYATGPGSDPDVKNCIIALSPSIWVNQGGWWGSSTSGQISENGSGAWRQSSVTPSTIIGSSMKSDADQVFTLDGVPSPMAVNKSGTGTLLKAGNQMPDGPIRWEIINVTSSGTGSGGNLAGDGGDDNS